MAERTRPIGGSTETITYQHTDALGTPVLKTSASRVILERREYEPYGKLLNLPLESGPGYTGHDTDPDTWYTYMQQRYYDPRVGRFWSVDPVTVDNVGGNFNRYWYANNNPYRFKDPDGRAPFCSDWSPCGSGSYGGDLRPLTRSAGPIGCASCETAPRGPPPPGKTAGEINRVMEKYEIDNPTGATIMYYPGLRGADGANPYPGVIYLGNSAFSTESYLAGVIGHEVRHEVQRLEGRYGSRADEAEAYKYNVENASRFHSTQRELQDATIQFHNYFDGLSKSEQDRINYYDYTYP